MATPTVRRKSNQSSRSGEPKKGGALSLNTRRFMAWTAEITLVVASGLIPFGIGAYASNNNITNRVPLNPVLILIEREVARPLALPVNYGTRNVAWVTNFLWTIALLAPLSISGWQVYLLARTGSTLPKRLLGIKVVAENGAPPGLSAVLLREGIGRWTIPMSIAYLLWRISPAFPSLGIFTFISGLIILGESAGLPFKRGSRALHDRLAGTYTIDANESFIPGQLSNQSDTDTAWEEGDEEEKIASVVITPEPRKRLTIWQKMQRNPSLTLFIVAFLSMSAVLITLVGTQIYIQTQKNSRSSENESRKQFLALVKKLDSDTNVSIQERQKAILAIGTLNNEQAIKHLVDLLIFEKNSLVVDTIQRALENIGTKAIPYLLKSNLSLAKQLSSVGNVKSAQQELILAKLHRNQKAINRILVVEGGQTDGVNLSNSYLAQTGSGDKSFFNLVLDTVNLWGINFRSANLDGSSFVGTNFRGPGEDGRWDTYDDSIANLSQAQLQKSNLSDANLSRVLMNRANFSRAVLKRANLNSARLISANLSSAQLSDADLRNAVLENASLTGADLGNAKFNEADLHSARLGRVIATGAQFSSANLTKTDWQGGDLSGAYFDGANLSDSNLSGTRLTRTILRSANLENANLRNADLSLADLTGANLTNADFQGVILFPDKQNPADEFVQTPTIGSESAIVKGVDFSRVKNLDRKQRAYICSQGGFLHPVCPQ
ncbi:MAG: pentapeptide repeat-containing protein [Cyanobacteria bacterium P01_A01_bin.45]